MIYSIAIPCIAKGNLNLPPCIAIPENNINETKVVF